jgi:hypothetical protein
LTHVHERVADGVMLLEASTDGMMLLQAWTDAGASA